MHDVGIGLRDPAHDVGEREDVGWIGLPVHGHAAEPERQRRLELAQHVVGMRSAGQAVGDEAHAVAARDLLAGQVEHVAE